MKLNRSYLILAGICFHLLVQGQSYLPFEHLGLNEGISHTLINVTLQDRQGFLWVGAQDGLNRYDGHRFQVFRPDDTPGSIYGRWITQLYEDREGQLWIRFRTGGLNRFDPVRRRFYLYLHDPEDPRSVVGDFHSDFRFSHVYKNMLETSDGTLWIGSTQGLSRYVRSQDHFENYRHEPDDNQSLSGNFITALAEGADSSLWIGTSKGLNRLDLNNGRIARISLQLPDGRELSNPYIINLQPDRYGNIWIGTRWDGLLRLRYDPQGSTSTVRQYLCNLDLPPHERLDGILSILETRNGELWVGGEAGLFFLNPDQYEFLQVPGTEHLKKADHLLEDSRGVIWADVDEQNTGMVRISRDRKQAAVFSRNRSIPGSLSVNAVNCIMEDRSGVLWIGTVKGGLNRLDLNRKPFQHYFHDPSNPNSLNANDVYAIYEDERERLWVGTIKGLNRIDRKTGRVQVYEKDPLRPGLSPSANIIGVIEPDPSGFLWLGYFDYKISRFFPETGRFNHFHHHELIPDSYQAWSLRDIVSNGPGDTWFGACTYGLTQLQPDGQTFRYFSNPRPAMRNHDSSAQMTDQKINCLYKDRSGILWIGAQDSGLSRFDPASYSFSNFTHDPEDGASISDNEVKCIYEDVQGVFWIGTGGGGLNRFDRKTGKFISYTTDDGLGNNTIHGILPDNTGRLWLSTNKGLSCFDPTTGRVKRYYADDGLQSNEFNEGAYFRSARGELFFGGVNGLTSFFPDSIADNPILPEVVITEFRLFNKTVLPGDTINGRLILDQAIEYTDRIQLTHRESIFSFEFAALHFAAPAQNQFAYILEGFDPEWTETGADKRYVTYTNLNPGEYTFRVKASNNDEGWNEEGVSIHLTILPPWWNTPLFRRSMFVLLILLTLLTIRLRTAQLKAQKVRLKKLVTKRTRALTLANAQLAESREALLRQKEQIESQKKNLEEVDESKTRFYTNLAHEFRTPLSLILGASSDLLKQSNLTAAQQSNLRMLERNTQRLLRLVSQILDLSKLEEGVLKLEVTPGNIAGHIQLMADSFQSLARQRNLSFTVTTNRQNATGFFDQDKVEKIIYNLLYNAFKFTPDGGQVHVQINTQGPAEKPEFVEISVQDNGPGIPEDERSAIFNRFYQGTGKTNSQGGTGIGLSLVQHLVSLHGGELHLRSDTSEEKHGTIFTVRLPLRPEAYAETEVAMSKATSKPVFTLADALTPHSSALSFSASTTPPEILPKLLVVEDDPDMRSYIRRSLSGLFQVIEAGDGSEGFSKAREHLPELILTDVMMPQLNGLAFCRKLKSDTQTSHIPVIILTAKSSGEAELEGLSIGADDYITKPFQSAVLQLKLKNMIDNRRRLAERYKQDIWMDMEKTVHSPSDKGLLRRAIRIIEDHLNDPELDVALFTKKMGMGRTVLYEKIKAMTGLSVNDLIKTHRLKMGARLLIEEKLSISEVSYRVGFNDPKYFSKCFKKQFNKSPKEFIIQHSG